MSYVSYILLNVILVFFNVFTYFLSALGMTQSVLLYAL